MKLPDDITCPTCFYRNVNVGDLICSCGKTFNMETVKNNAWICPNCGLDLSDFNYEKKMEGKT